MGDKTTQTQSQTSNTNQTTRPLEEQFPFLQAAWQQAGNTLNKVGNNQYGGQLIAGLTPEQINNFQGMYDYARSSGNPAYSGAVASGAANTAGSLANTGAGYAGTAGGLYDMSRGLIGNGTNLTNTGAGSTLGSISRLNNFTPTGGVNDNISAAGAYADNPFLSGQVDAAMRDARRSVSEQALPQIAREASLTGNIGSSKRGIAEGLVERGLAEKTADVSAGLRGDAYNHGLDLSEQGRQFNSNAILDAIKAGGSLGTNLLGSGVNLTGTGISGINAGTGAGTLGLGYQGAGLDASKLGLDANNQQLAQQAGLFNLAGTAGEGLQQGNQQTLDAARAMQEYGNTNAWNDLARYYGIVGANNWGGTTTGTTNSTGTVDQTKNASPFTIAGGLLGGATSLFGTGGLNMLQPAGASLYKNLFG
jgi:hypothetical protein